MLTPFSQVPRNINIPLVWRYEYSAGAVGPYNTPTLLTVAMGLTVIYTHVVPLTEISHLRCRWKAVAHSAAATTLAISIYVDTVLLDLTSTTSAAGSEQTGIAEDILLNHAAVDANVEFKLQAGTATESVYYYKCSIDVCRA